MVETIRKKSQLTWKCAIRWRFRSATRRTFDSAGELPHSVPLCSDVVPKTMRSKRYSPWFFCFSLLKRRVKANSMLASGQSVERRNERNNYIYLYIYIILQSSRWGWNCELFELFLLNVIVQYEPYWRKKKKNKLEIEKIFYRDRMGGTFIYLLYFEVLCKYFQRFLRVSSLRGFLEARTILANRFKSDGWRLDQDRPCR